MPRAVGEASARNPWLDLVRSVAIVLVLLRHGARALEVPGPTGPLRALMLNGWVGVDLFFVLSGYLISRQLLRDPGTLCFTRYLLRRGLRIVPSYLAALTLVVLGAFPLFVVSGERLELRVLYHLVFLQDYLPSDINVVFWSLAVEEKFYLLAPFLVRYLGLWSGGRALVVLLLLALAAPFLRALTFGWLDAPIDYETFFRALRSPFHACLEPLIAGVGLAVAERRGWLARLAPWRGVLFPAAALALVAWLAHGELLAEIGRFDAVLQPVLNAILCAILTAGAILLAGVRMPLAPAVATLATLSFTLYLVHFPLVPLARALAEATGHPIAGFWAFYLGLSTACAALLHFGVERPFLLFRDRLPAPRPLSTSLP